MSFTNDGTGVLATRKTATIICQKPDAHKTIDQEPTALAQSFPRLRVDIQFWRDSVFSR
jgi:hypothetical protein